MLQHADIWSHLNVSDQVSISNARVNKKIQFSKDDFLLVLAHMASNNT